MPNSYTSQDIAFLQSVGGKLLDTGVVQQLYGASAAMDPHWDFGWIPFERRTPEQMQNYDQIMRKMPVFQITGSWQMDQRRYSLWKAGAKVFGAGKFLPYNHQLTGSCVGAGGGNMAKTLMAMQAAAGLMEYRELFWPYTYGKSRERDGSHSEGEGSTGSSYADAATQDGYVAFDEDATLGSATFDNGGWLTLTDRIEMKWSNGRAAPDKEVTIGKTHLIRTKAPMRSSDDCLAALANGYPITQASNFGFSPMVPSPTSDPPVRLVSWNGSWSHQTYIDEVWDHPKLGIIFRWGNNWGADAHGPALADEPPSSVYITAKTLDSICKNGEVFAFSPDISGFPARSIPWTF